jgi:hypothetical protein
MKKSNTGIIALIVSAVSSAWDFIGFGKKYITGESPRRKQHWLRGVNTGYFHYTVKKNRHLPGQLRRAGEYFRTHPQLFKQMREKEAGQ